MGLFPESIAHSQVMQPELSKWNLAEMAYVGSIASVNPALVRRKDAPAKTIEEMKRISSNVAAADARRRAIRSRRCCGTSAASSTRSCAAIRVRPNT
jgi:hypothetical protein